MGRAPCCEKVGLKRGRWTAEEDRILVNYIKEYGEGSWRCLPKNAGLLRCGKSCRLRWVNYLKEDLKRGNISAEEEKTILKLQATLGNRWSVIAAQLPGRTDNEIKNYWNAHLSKKAAAGAATAEAGGGGGEQADDDGQEGEACSEGAGSTVVDADKDSLDEDSVTSSILVSTKGIKRKGKGDVRGESSKSDNCGKRKMKEKKKRGESRSDQSKERMEKKSEKKMRKKRTLETEDNCGGEHGRCQHNCATKEEEEKTASALTDDEAGGREVVKKDSKKTSKKRPKLANLQPARTEREPAAEAANEQEAGVNVRACSTMERQPQLSSTVKTEHGYNADTSRGAACCAAGCGAAELGPGTHVGDGVEIADGDLLLGCSSHVEHAVMDVDLLDAIDSDGGFLEPSASMDQPLGSLLLDYLDFNFSDASCCWTGTPPRCQEVDNVAGVWPGSPAVTTPSTMMTNEAVPTSCLDGCSTTSSYVDLGHVGQLYHAGSTAGTAVDDAIGSLPWEAEEDFWRLLAEFGGDVEVAAGPVPEEEEEAPPTLPQQPTTMVQGFHSSIAHCGGDVFADDDAFESPWFLTDAFLS